MFRRAPVGMTLTTLALVVVVVVALVIAAVVDSGEHRGAFIALSIVWGAFTLGAVLLTRGVSRRLGGDEDPR